MLKTNHNHEKGAFKILLSPFGTKVESVYKALIISTSIKNVKQEDLEDEVRRALRRLLAKEGRVYSNIYRKT